MDKETLHDYVDTCELIRETERELERLEKKRYSIARDSVSGSNPEFPYERKTFKVEGAYMSDADAAMIVKKQHLLEQRKRSAEQKKYAIEMWLLTVPSRIQRIIRYRYIEGFSWERVADRMGRECTGESVRKELERYLEK